MVIGSAEYATGDQLLRDADVAMYRAKDAGRDRHELFNDEIRLQEIERHETERTLRGALDDDRLRLLYQPIVDLHTGRPTGAEALLRIADPDQGMLRPRSFLTSAQDSRLIFDLGAWVLDRVCAQLAEWSENGLGHLGVWVNVTGQELASPRFVAVVQRAIDAHRIKPGRLHIECAENALLEANPETLDHLRSLNETGVHFGIDDFGTGYSSLAYLRELPIELLEDRPLLHPPARRARRHRAGRGDREPRPVARARHHRGGRRVPPSGRGARPDGLRSGPGAPLRATGSRGSHHPAW